MNEFADRPVGSFDVESEYANPRMNLARPGRRPRTGYKMVPIEKPEPRLIDIQVCAEYQLFGDIETTDWEERTFGGPSDGIDDRPVVKDHSLLYVTTGAWGLRFVTFMVDIEVPVGTQDQIRDAAQSTLYQLVGETDIELRYITML